MMATKTEARRNVRRLLENLKEVDPRTGEQTFRQMAKRFLSCVEATTNGTLLSSHGPLANYARTKGAELIDGFFKTISTDNKDVVMEMVLEIDDELSSEAFVETPVAPPRHAMTAYA